MAVRRIMVVAAVAGLLASCGDLPEPPPSLAAQVDGLAATAADDGASEPASRATEPATTATAEPDESRTGQDLAESVAAADARCAAVYLRGEALASRSRTQRRRTPASARSPASHAPRSSPPTRPSSD